MSTFKLNPNLLYQNGTAPDTIPSQTDMIARDTALVPLDGSRAMSGPLVLPADPIADLQAATKRYVDNLAGDIFVESFRHQYPNDADAIRAAIAAASSLASAASGAAVYRVVLSKAVYTIEEDSNGGIVIPSNVHVVSFSRSILKNTASFISDVTNAPAAQGYSLVVDGDNVAIKGIHFYCDLPRFGTATNLPVSTRWFGGGKAGTEAIIQIGGGANLEISDCEFTGLTVAMYLAGRGTDNTQQWLSNPVIRNNRFHGCMGVLIRCFSNCLMLGNVSDDIADYNSDPNHQVYITDRSAVRSTGLNVIGCNDYYSTGVGESWKLRNVDGFQVVGCKSQHAGRGIMVDSCTNGLIDACHIGKLTVGEVPVTTNGVTTEISDTQPSGITIWDSPGTVVSNCVCESTTNSFSMFRTRTSYSQIASYTLASGSTTTMTFPAGTTTVAGKFVGLTVSVYDGAGAGSTVTVTAYDPSTLTATFTPALETSLDSTSVVMIHDDQTNSHVVFKNCTAVVDVNDTTKTLIYQPLFMAQNTGYVDFDNCTIINNGTVDFYSRAFYVQNSYNVRVLNPRYLGVTAGTGLTDPFIYFHATTTQCVALIDPISLGYAFDGNIVYNGSDAVVRQVGFADVTGNLVPSSPGAASLGTATTYWKNVFAQQINVYNVSGNYTATLTGNALTLAGSNNNIINAAGQNLQLQVAGTTYQTLTTTAVSFVLPLLPSTTQATNIGGTSAVWANGYFNTLSLISTTGTSGSVKSNGVAFGSTSVNFVNATQGYLALQVAGTNYLTVAASKVTLPAGTALLAGTAGTTIIDGNGFKRDIVVTALVSAGTGQASATSLTGQTNQLTTSTNTGGAGFVLPAAVAGMPITVINADTAHDALIYPPTGCSINALAVNTAYTLAAGTTATFRFVSTTQCYV